MTTLQPPQNAIIDSDQQLAAELIVTELLKHPEIMGFGLRYSPWFGLQIPLHSFLIDPAFKTPSGMEQQTYRFHLRDDLVQCFNHQMPDSVLNRLDELDFIRPKSPIPTTEAALLLSVTRTLLGPEDFAQWERQQLLQSAPLTSISSSFSTHDPSAGYPSDGLESGAPVLNKSRKSL